MEGVLEEAQVRAMFDRIAGLYDRMNTVMTAGLHHQWRRRAADLAQVPRGGKALDVACGTGNHIGVLRKWYNVEGIDNSSYMLRQARRKYPDIQFKKADMKSFRLKQRFDIITCLFSAVGHLRNRTELIQTIRNMNDHLKPGGLLILE